MPSPRRNKAHDPKIKLETYKKGVLAPETSGRPTEYGNPLFAVEKNA